MKKLLGLLVLLALFAVFVWPTRYQQYTAGEGPYAAQVASDAPTRVDRLTGDVAVQEPSGQWRRIGNARTATAFEQPAIDPSANTRPSARDNQRLANQQRRSVAKTQEAVQSATQPPVE